MSCLRRAKENKLFHSTNSKSPEEMETFCEQQDGRMPPEEPIPCTGNVLVLGIFAHGHKLDFLCIQQVTNPKKRRKEGKREMLMGLERKRVGCWIG